LNAYFQVEGVYYLGHRVIQYVVFQI
jgi:hypothetical protein